MEMLFDAFEELKEQIYGLQRDLRQFNQEMNQSLDIVQQRPDTKQSMKDSPLTDLDFIKLKLFDLEREIYFLKRGRV
jgi:hypothetical protein